MMGALYLFSQSTINTSSLQFFHGRSWQLMNHKYFIWNKRGWKVLTCIKAFYFTLKTTYSWHNCNRKQKSSQKENRKCIHSSRERGDCNSAISQFTRTSKQLEFEVFARKVHMKHEDFKFFIHAFTIKKLIITSSSCKTDFLTLCKLHSEHWRYIS